MTDQTKNRPVPGLKMKELAEASGLPKSTILHYVNEGLLPKPVKTSPNMAWYDPACVDRLALIRRMQKDYRLPVAKIRDCLERMDRGEDMTPFIELDQAIFPAPTGPLLSRQEFLARTGLTAKQLTDLVTAELVIPCQTDRFDEADVAVGLVLARSFENGFTPADFEIYPRLGREIVEAEMDLRRRRTGHLPDDQDAQLTLEMVRGGPVDESLCHRPDLPETDRRLHLLKGVNPRCYVFLAPCPSPPPASTARWAVITTLTWASCSPCPWPAR